MLMGGLLGRLEAAEALPRGTVMQALAEFAEFARVRNFWQSMISSANLGAGRSWILPDGVFVSQFAWPESRGRSWTAAIPTVRRTSPDFRARQENTFLHPRRLPSVGESFPLR